MAESEAQTRARRRYIDKKRRKAMDTETLAADLARGYITIKESEEPGDRRFWIELVAPQSVQDALALYCERQGISVEDYLEDVGRETVLAASRK